MDNTGRREPSLGPDTGPDTGPNEGAAGEGVATAALPGSIDAVLALLAGQQYVCDRRLATALFLSLKLQRPLFLEGEPGVGKTELAKSLAAGLGSRLLRVQCYDGLDVAQTAYEWNVARQMMAIRLAEAGQAVATPAERERLAQSLYGREMLIERPPTPLLPGDAPAAPR